MADSSNGGRRRGRVRPRPCRICRRWFTPSARVGDRQRVCSAEACQRERHRRSCASWRSRESRAERAHGVRQRFVVDPDPGSDALVRARLRWDGLRDVVSPDLVVVLEVLAEVLDRRGRDGVSSHVVVAQGDGVRLPTPARTIAQLGLSSACIGGRASPDRCGRGAQGCGLRARRDEVPQPCRL